MLFSDVENPFVLVTTDKLPISDVKMSIFCGLFVYFNGLIEMGAEEHPARLLLFGISVIVWSFHYSVRRGDMPSFSFYQIDDMSQNWIDI